MVVTKLWRQPPTSKAMLCINIHTHLLELQTMSYNTVEGVRGEGGKVGSTWQGKCRRTYANYNSTTPALVWLQSLEREAPSSLLPDYFV